MNTIISTYRLLQHWNPYRRVLWCETPISVDSVRRFVRDNWVLPPWDEHRGVDTTTHERRVAWLCLHRDNAPIDVEWLGYRTASGKAVVVHDGNHRIAAAIAMRWRFIPADISGFYIEGIRELTSHVNQGETHGIVHSRKA